MKPSWKFLNFSTKWVMTSSRGRMVVRRWKVPSSCGPAGGSAHGQACSSEATPFAKTFFGVRRQRPQPPRCRNHAASRARHVLLHPGPGPGNKLRRHWAHGQARAQGGQEAAAFRSPAPTPPHTRVQRAARARATLPLGRRACPPPLPPAPPSLNSSVKIIVVMELMSMPSLPRPYSCATSSSWAWPGQG